MSPGGIVRYSRIPNAAQRPQESAQSVGGRCAKMNCAGNAAKCSRKGILMGITLLRPRSYPLRDKPNSPQDLLAFLIMAALIFLLGALVGIVIEYTYGVTSIRPWRKASYTKKFY